MKAMKKILLSIMLFLLFGLIGCSFILDNPTPPNKENEAITSFEIITDDKMIIDQGSSSKYYHLTLYVNEKYQIKTTIDDKIKDEYYFKYVIDEDVNNKFTITETGLIEVADDLQKYELFFIDIELYKKDTNKKITVKYLSLALEVGEYANIVLKNDNIEYDEVNSVYSMTMNSGSSFYISYQVSYNTPYVLSFSLRDSSYLSFMNVDSDGKITTTKISEDKFGEISIKLTGSNGILDEVILRVHLKKSEDLIDRLVIVNQENANVINDKDLLDLCLNQKISFDIKYNNEEKTNVITVENSNVLELNNQTNTITALNEGTSKVIFEYESKQITITINVIKDNIISFGAENADDDFIIINNELHFLNYFTIEYSSGKIENIEDNSLISYQISDVDEKYKNVSFKYQDVEISYNVKYYDTVLYQGLDSMYHNNDYFNNSAYGKANVLPDEGIVKLLVIPVWFNDSNKFFKDEQKNQLIEDIKYTMKSDRPETELESVKQYYEMQSYNAITMDITVSDFYNSNTSYQDYSDILESKVENSHILGTEAISWYFSNNKDEKLSDYDLNNDGLLDGVILFYAANYYGAKEDKNRSYAFASTNYDNVYSYNTMAFCPIAGLYGLEFSEPTAQLLLTDLSKTYDMAFRSSSRTVIHEIGHMFGNIDLYEPKSGDEKYIPAGGFVMQDNNCGGHDPYHVNRIGWSKPQVYASSDYNLGDKITIHLADFQSTGQNIILTNKWNSLYDEYLILELFAPTVLNKFDSEIIYMNKVNSGIRLWHVNSILEDYDELEKTSTIINGHRYKLVNSNYDSDNPYDILHLIRNNPNEEYNSTSGIPNDNVLFNVGDFFDMSTFKSQFSNDEKFDNNDKLGWKFTVDAIYKNVDGTYGAIITLERIDNQKTEFSETISLNRNGLEPSNGENDYSNQIFGENGDFSITYNLVTPPSIYEQGFPISSKGMCLFASSDGNGGYIDIKIKDVEGKEVVINSITITYSYLTKASLTVLSSEKVIDGQRIDPLYSNAYTYKYDVNSKSIRIQNQYNETIDHWSVLPLLEITIDYTIK